MRLISALSLLLKSKKISHCDIDENSYLKFDGEKVVWNTSEEIFWWDFLNMITDLDEDGWKLFED
jgi:hypothetical protein